ncbi:MAG: hypothetical protein PWR03_2183, partial [Tenuifilum sp.]|uniref:hypothetical protein n=1 Tax=Tenuifilum sp. TaxID=2760880 RepID=UPI0024ABCB49
ECIYAQVLYLTKSGFRVEVICSQKTLKHLEYLKGFCPVKSYDFSEVLSFFKLWWYLLQQKKSHIVLNTAQGNRVLKLLTLPTFRKVKFYGIIHNLKKLEASSGQKLISRKINQYLVIADYLKESPAAVEKGIKSINTSIFPNADSFLDIPKHQNIWITIPGNIELKRRDYHWIIDVCSKNKLPNNIKFILLGNASKGDGKEIIDRIKNEHIENQFIWFDKFVNQNVFNDYIKKSDYLLPLLHENRSEYLIYKTSGTFSLSEAFSKPMILHSNFRNLNKYYCIEFYSNIPEFIHIISKQPVIKCKPFDFEKNRIQYLEALKLI